MSDSPLDALDPRLREILDRIPVEPGVYLMKDKKGRVIYIGKASSLRARVRSYFTRSGDVRAFVSLLDRLLGDIETVVTNNEKEALLLENNLIKQHQPRFNIKLVDDKNYLVLRLAMPPAGRAKEGADQAARYPRLEVTRRIGTDGARYFGPYCRQTLRVVNRHFKLRTCSDQVLANRERPCLQYQIKRCDAPCVFPVAEEQYAEQVRDVALFLEGKDSELLERLRARMREASAGQEYEVAAAVRDQIVSLEKTLTEQRVVSEEPSDQDVIGYYREGANVEIAVLHVRQGKLLGRRTFSLGGQEFPDEEIVSSFVSLYYDLGSNTSSGM
jgi:excinuclease ABC subunit C